MSSGNIGPLSEDLENLIGDLIGSNWRFLPDTDLNGALGIAIVYSVLKGCPTNVGAISNSLNIEKWRLQKPFRALSMSGVFQRNKLEDDRKKLEEKDPLTWLYYAGYAAEAIGNVGHD